MKILGLDTATESCSAALLVDGRIVSREQEFERGHAEHILLMVDQVLAEASVRLSDLDAIAFGRGPGAFTGVRLAASVAQGLAFASGVPVVPVSDLAAVAQRALGLAFRPDRVLVCSDARMQEVYWACFALDPNGFAMIVGSEHVSHPDKVELPAAWQDGTSMPVGVGRGFRAYPSLGVRLQTQVRVARDDLLPRAIEVAQLAAVDAMAGRLLTPEEAIPVYLRDDVARPQSRN